jgi:glycosyltransferase involved in cell wall biosynthesis
MTFYRHFVERNDFSLQVHTVPSRVQGFSLPYEPIKNDLPFAWKRFKNTRFYKVTETIELLYGSLFLPARSVVHAREFMPDVIFTVGGCFDWTSLAARKLAKICNVPLVASFNDWFDYPWFTGLPFTKKIIENNFKRFYRSADLALCTSDGMRDELGNHANSHVWYPSGAKLEEVKLNDAPAVEPHQKFTIFFGGSLGEWYGTMLENLVRLALKDCPHLKFKIFGSLQSWSKDFDQIAKDRGIFLGSVPFDELKVEAQYADLLILPMGFNPEAAHIERTSFKTKFLDYLSFRKPILVWGPEYCSAVRVAREFDSAEIVSDSCPSACLGAINKLYNYKARRIQLVDNAMTMYRDRFHPDKIHQVLVDQINELIVKRNKDVA